MKRKPFIAILLLVLVIGCTSVPPSNANDTVREAIALDGLIDAEQPNHLVSIRPKKNYDENNKIGTVIYEFFRLWQVDNHDVELFAQKLDEYWEFADLFFDPNPINRREEITNLYRGYGAYLEKHPGSGTFATIFVDADYLKSDSAIAYVELAGAIKAPFKIAMLRTENGWKFDGTPTRNERFLAALNMEIDGLTNPPGHEYYDNRRYGEKIRIQKGIRIKDALPIQKSKLVVPPGEIAFWNISDFGDSKNLYFHYDLALDWVVLPKIAVCSEEQLYDYRKTKNLSCSTNFFRFSSSSEIAAKLRDPISPYISLYGTYDHLSDETHYLTILNPSNSNDLPVSIGVYFETLLEISSFGGYPDSMKRFHGEILKIFPDLDLSLRLSNCGDANAYYSGFEIVFCAEFIEALNLGDFDGDEFDGVLQTIAHEYAHAALHKWSFPNFQNEEQADELSTIFMMLYLISLNNADDAVSYFGDSIEYWKRSAKDSISDVLTIGSVGAPHPLPIQRARKIHSITSCPEYYVALWFPFLSSKMNQSVLKEIAAENDPFGFAPMARKILNGEPPVNEPTVHCQNRIN